MSAMVNVVLDDLKASLQLIADFNGRTVHILSETDFFDKIKGGTDHAIGIMYEGLRPKGEVGKETHKVGLSSELGVALLLAMPNKTLVGGDLKGTAIEYLDIMRNQIKDTRSKTGHFWRFLLEAPAIEKGGYTIWVQRWSTPIQLT